VVVHALKNGRILFSHQMSADASDRIRRRSCLRVRIDLSRRARPRRLAAFGVANWRGGAKEKGRVELAERGKQIGLPSAGQLRPWPRCHSSGSGVGLGVGESTCWRDGASGHGPTVRGARLGEPHGRPSLGGARALDAFGSRTRARSFMRRRMQALVDGQPNVSAKARTIYVPTPAARRRGLAAL